MAQRICSIGGCSRPAIARGWCGPCYKRQRRKGVYLAPLPSTTERFWAKVTKTRGCWLWNGAIEGGYGRFAWTEAGVRRRTVAHRYAYETLVGPVPGELVLDHLCRERRCVNPAHLEAVTSKENVLRGVGQPALNHRKTRCVNGHELIGRNVLARKDGRECRTCRDERCREWNRAHPDRRR